MEQPACKVQVLKKGERCIVLAGDRQIHDMLIFLMYRKLDSIIRTKQSEGGLRLCL